MVSGWDARPLQAEINAIERLVHRARYRQAFRRADRLARSNPDSLLARYVYAVLLGDNHEGLTMRRIEHNRGKCVRILRPLLHKLRGLDPLTRHRIRNEYYWFSRQHRRQYGLGLEGTRRGIAKGLYSQGVGAAWYALTLAQRGQARRASRWATIAAAAWRKFISRNDYYNAYVHFALALGVTGRLREMEAALSRGARIAGRPDSYREFEEIRTLIRSLP